MLHIGEHGGKSKAVSRGRRFPLPPFPRHRLLDANIMDYVVSFFARKCPVRMSSFAPPHTLTSFSLQTCPKTTLLRSHDFGFASCEDCLGKANVHDVG